MFQERRGKEKYGRFAVNLNPKTNNFNTGDTQVDARERWSATAEGFNGGATIPS
jgi:hypothetical protein